MKTESSDLSPEQWTIYGYIVLRQIGPDKWETETSEEYTNLPAHEVFKTIAEDRVNYLREHGVNARVAALIQDKDYDTPERMDEAKKEA